MKLIVALWGTLFAVLIAGLGYSVAGWFFSRAAGWGMWVAAWVSVWLTTAALVIAIAHAVVVITPRLIIVNGEVVRRSDLVAVQVSPDPTELFGVRLVKLPGAAPLVVREGATRRFASEVLLSGFHAFTMAGARRVTDRVAHALQVSLETRVADHAPRHASADADEPEIVPGFEPTATSETAVPVEPGAPVEHSAPVEHGADPRD